MLRAIFEAAHVQHVAHVSREFGPDFGHPLGRYVNLYPRTFFKPSLPAIAWRLAAALLLRCGVAPITPVHWYLTHIIDCDIA